MIVVRVGLRCVVAEEVRALPNCFFLRGEVSEAIVIRDVKELCDLAGVILDGVGFLESSEF